ncbi:hypothetical protein PHAGE_JEFFCO_47 [Acinetobacter phage JeffCo]|nr:hypothetical protein PHAGE_JEFFCO_47 [Acinetobacter phage JeffCo]
MNLIIKILAMVLAMISVIVILFIASVGGLLYVFLWLVGALSVLTVSVYQWWVKLLTDVKGLGSAESD